MHLCEFAFFLRLRFVWRRGFETRLLCDGFHFVDFVPPLNWLRLLKSVNKKQCCWTHYVLSPVADMASVIPLIPKVWVIQQLCFYCLLVSIVSTSCSYLISSINVNSVSACYCSSLANICLQGDTSPYLLYVCSLCISIIYETENDAEELVFFFITITEFTIPIRTAWQ